MTDNNGNTRIRSSFCTIAMFIAEKCYGARYLKTIIAYFETTAAIIR